MKDFLKRIPIPMAGVALGFTALGNLLVSYGTYIRYICGFIAFCLLSLVLLKCIILPKVVKEDFKNPVIASVSATIFMTTMQLTTYIANLNIPYIYDVAKIIWLIALSMHLLLIIYFTYRMFTELKLHHIYPTCFVTYVGIIIAAITSPTFHMEPLGKLIFWFGFILYIFMFIIISIRYHKHEIEINNRPLFVIYAAPMSLSLTGYLAVMDFPNITFAIIMAILAQIIYVVVVMQLPNLLKLDFYPSYAAFTFPLVISPFALMRILTIVSSQIMIPKILYLILSIEITIAIMMVFYAFYQYMKFIFKK